MTAPAPDVATGGYFSLESGTGAGLSWLAKSRGYQSARSAIAAVLTQARPSAVWVPHYICGAMSDALDFSGVRVRRYRLSEDFGVPADVEVDASDWLVAVDYFGICAEAVGRAQDRFGVERVLVDASQSLFHAARTGSSTVYSPRKFVGVPDGGLLLSGRDIPLPLPADEQASIDRCQPLLTRLSGDVEAGYRQFQAAEASLSSCNPVGISRLTSRLLAAIDFDRVATRRIANYRLMAAELGRHGLRVPALPAGAVPLCCPVLGVDAPALRKALAGRKIYTPAYWPDAMIPSDDQVARRLQSQTLFLPCDQRINPAQALTTVHVLAELLKSP